MTPVAFSSASAAKDAASVVADLIRALPMGVQPTVCLWSCTVAVDTVAVAAGLRSRFPRAAFVATTSCQQVASDHGATSTAAALFLCGDGFTAGAASGALGEGQDAVTLGEELAASAIARASTTVARVRLVVVHATPGIEEQVLEGLARVITDDAVVIGGSGADDDLSGRWRVCGPDGCVTEGAAILVCDWPWKMAVSYQGGYLATEHEGHITEAVGRRIVRIDDRPAAEVYEGWLQRPLPRGQSVLSLTTMNPLGIAYGVGSGLDVHVLVHPVRVDDDGSITCFAAVKTGDRVLMMEASTASLIRRGGLVCRYALQQAHLGVDDVIAGFLIYCAGCSLALGDDVTPMTAGVTKTLPGVPFLMPFTYGEQGRLRRSRVDHGNLMLSALLLTTRPIVTP